MPAADLEGMEDQLIADMAKAVDAKTQAEIKLGKAETAHKSAKEDLKEAEDAVMKIAAEMRDFKNRTGIFNPAVSSDKETPGLDAAAKAALSEEQSESILNVAEHEAVLFVREEKDGRFKARIKVCAEGDTFDVLNEMQAFASEKEAKSTRVGTLIDRLKKGKSSPLRKKAIEQLQALYAKLTK